MSKYFEINGYWKDDKEPFEGYIVKEFDDYDEDNDNGEDDLIFFYGLSENELIDAIEKKENTVHDFVITSYQEKQQY